MTHLYECERCQKKADYWSLYHSWITTTKNIGANQFALNISFNSSTTDLPPVGAGEHHFCSFKCLESMARTWRTEQIDRDREEEEQQAKRNLEFKEKYGK